MTCILSHYARCFCIRVPGKEIDFVPLGAMFLVLGCTCNTKVFMAWARCYDLGMDILVNTLEHERHYGLGSDALVIGCCRT